MDQIILHHYPQSPFSEKIRLGFGLKGLEWQSVTIPAIMPKPDLMPLTGGYRKTPVMQIGADVYCDTQLIMRELERRHPSSSFYAGSDAGTCDLLAWSFERAAFMPAVAVAFAAIGDFVPTDFIKDREKFSGGRLDIAKMRADREIYVDQLRPLLAWLAQMLADGRPFLMGSRPGLVDLAAYHPIWFMRSLMAAAAAAVPGVAPLLPWADRVAAIGHGRGTELSSSAALEIARNVEPIAVAASANEAATDLKLGSRVTVTPDDNGRDPVSGILLAASPHEIVLTREEPSLGRVNVHFPRAGFVLAG